MQSLLEPFTDKQIRIDQTGDKSISGRLVNVQADYATVWDGQQLMHYPYAHIKSVSTDITEYPVAVPVPNVEYVGTFIELLQTLTKKMVQIENGDGSRGGVLSDITKESISLIGGMKELTMYPIGQIKNISPKFTIASKKDSQAPNNQDAVSSSANTGNDKDSSDEQQTRKQSHDSAEKSSKQYPKIFNVTRAMSMLQRLNEMHSPKQVRRHKSTMDKRVNYPVAVGMTAVSPMVFGKRRSRRLQSR